MTKKDETENTGCCNCGQGGCGEGEDEGEGEEVYVFTDEDGTEREFFLAETMEIEGKEYALFLPLEEDEEEEEAEEESAVILRVEQDAEGNRNLVDLEDEEELNKVIEAWEAAMAEEEEEEEEEAKK